MFNKYISMGVLCLIFSAPCFSIDFLRTDFDPSTINIKLTNENYVMSEEEKALIREWDAHITQVKQLCDSVQYDQINGEEMERILLNAGQSQYLKFFENFVKSLYDIPRYVYDGNTIINMVLTSRNIVVPGLREYFEQAEKE